MSYIEIINNSEKYIEMLKQKDIIYIKCNDIKPSVDLVKRYDPLWGYYDVKSFTINNTQVSTNEIFLNYEVSCGDCFLRKRKNMRKNVKNKVLCKQYNNKF
jgi:hypothetical protein